MSVIARDYALLVLLVLGACILSLSFMPFSISVLMPSLASLNSRIPLPIPLASSGIFLPPNSSTTMSSVTINSMPFGTNKSKCGQRFEIDILKSFKKLLIISFRVIYAKIGLKGLKSATFCHGDSILTGLEIVAYIKFGCFLLKKVSIKAWRVMLNTSKRFRKRICVYKLHSYLLIISILHYIMPELLALKS